MSSIGGLSGTTSSSLHSTSSLRGYGGLASGLDRDTLIQNLTSGTRSKIAKQQQKKQTYQWEQDTLRNITGKMYDLSNKFMSYSSPTNLASGKLFARNLITALGTHKDLISVSGTSTSADTISILGVKQLAENAQMSSNDSVSDRELNTHKIHNSLSESTLADQVSGDTLFIKYGNKSYSVTMPQGKEYDYSTVQSTKDALNKALGNVSIGSGKTLADVMSVSNFTDADGKEKLTFEQNAADTTGNLLKLDGATGDLLVDLGFMDAGEKFESMPTSDKIITTSGLKGKNEAKPSVEMTLAEQLSEKKISFSYNGTIKWITLGKYNGDPAKGAVSQLSDVVSDIQKGLDEAFGKERILVNIDSSLGDPTMSSLKFTTIKPGRKSDGTYDEDPSSVLSITASDRGVIGNNSIFGIYDGESNRLNTSVGIKDSGLKRGNLVPADPDTDMIIKNGSASVNLKDLGLNWNSSVEDIMNAINNSKELGIKVTYQANSDKFLVQSTEQGASGQIALDGNLAETLFGTKGTDYTVEQGQDAVLTVKYAGSNDTVEINRGSNTMTVDGLNLTLKGTFGYDALGKPDPGIDPVTFRAEVDTDTTAKAVKDMITAYNETLELINKEAGEKPNRDYAPLTDEQKKDLSESQIEKWETEAKKGILFNDSDLSSLSDKLRFIIPSEFRSTFANMGITVSTDYSDNGKLVFDETKFKAALGKDPEAVKNAFNAPPEVKEDGTTTRGGLMTNMKTIMDQYASMTGATKGILVERAGSVYAPTTVLQNGIQKQIEDINKTIDRLNDSLKTEQNRYIKQFTTLETLISQMNSQSSYLSSMFNS